MGDTIPLSVSLTKYSLPSKISLLIRRNSLSEWTILFEWSLFLPSFHTVHSTQPQSSLPLSFPSQSHFVSSLFLSSGLNLSSGHSSLSLSLLHFFHAIPLHCDGDFLLVKGSVPLSPGVSSSLPFPSSVPSFCLLFDHYEYIPCHFISHNHHFISLVPSESDGFLLISFFHFISSSKFEKTAVLSQSRSYSHYITDFFDDFLIRFYFTHFLLPLSRHLESPEECSY